MLTRQQIATALATRSPTVLWAALLSHARTLQPFWMGAVEAFAVRTLFAEEEKNDHLGVIADAFDAMERWRSGKAERISPRRNDIDSAIHFLREQTLDVRNSRLRYAPAARNAAGTLRACLAVSVRDYGDGHLPQVLGSVVFDLAAVRTLFPYDFEHLMDFHPGHDVPAGEDPFALTLQRAGRELGAMPAVIALKIEVERIWENFSAPSPLKFAEGYWNAERDEGMPG